MAFLWDETQGRIFGCHFVKKDGVMRAMVARRGVRKYLAGGDLPYDARQKLLLPVFDMQTRAYRNVNLASLVSFEIGGETFLVVD
jgi:hypothetical protein